MKKLINKGNKRKLNELVKNKHPHDIIQDLNTLSELEVNKFYELIEEKEVSRIIAFLEPEDAADIIDNFDLENQKDIIDNLDLDDAADIFIHLDKQEELIDTLENEMLISKVLTYDDDLVGAHMSDGFIPLTLGMGVKEATKIVIANADDVETINHLFVVDNDNKFKGMIPLKKLIKATPPQIIDELIVNNPYVLDTDDIEEAIHKIQDYRLYEMAVLNEEHKLIGVLTIDDAIEIYHKEAIEDFEKLAALPDTTEKSLFKAALSRLPWLLTLLVLLIPIALATSRFEDVIAAVAILAFFQPLILDAGGDVATQTLAVTLRILSKDSKRALKNGSKEILTGVINGFILGISGFLISYLIGLGLGSTEPIGIALVVGLALSLTIIISPIFALFIPLILNKFKIDPAIASGPFITTLIDITSVFIYFGLATLFLGVL